MPGLIGLPEFEIYKELFVRGSYGIKKGFGLQRKGETWDRINRAVFDSDVEDHLLGNISLQAMLPRYPVFAMYDVDNFPTSSEDGSSMLEAFIVKLYSIGMRDGQFSVYSSPSYFSAGHFHVWFRPVFRGNLASRRHLEEIFAPLVVVPGVEFFPSGEKLIRCPLGRDQLLLDSAGRPLAFSWQENLERLLALDEFEFSELYRQLPIQKPTRFRIRASARNIKASLDEVIQNPGSQFNAIMKLAQQFYYDGMSAADSEKIMLDAILKQRGLNFPKTSPSEWRKIQAKIAYLIHRKYKWLLDQGRHPRSSPDGTGWVVQGDLFTVCRTFPGSYIEQKKFFRLISEYRHLLNGKVDYAPMSWWRWRSILGDEYKLFQRVLEGQGLLTMDNSYCPREFIGYSKRFKLSIGEADSKKKLLKAGKSIISYRLAMLHTFGAYYAAMISKLSPRVFQRPESDEALLISSPNV
jgi:hypothetical protein